MSQKCVKGGETTGMRRGQMKVSAAATATCVTHTRQSSSNSTNLGRERGRERREKGRYAVASIATVEVRVVGATLDLCLRWSFIEIP